MTPRLFVSLCCLFSLGCGLDTAEATTPDELSVDAALTRRPLTGAGADTCALDGVWQCSMQRPSIRTGRVELRHANGCQAPFDVTFTQDYLGYEQFTRTVTRTSSASDTPRSFCISGTTSSCLNLTVTTQGSNMLRVLSANPYLSRTTDVLYWVDAQDQLHLQGNRPRNLVDGVCTRLSK